MPTRLSEHVLTDALTRLPGWSGDAEAIHRDYVVDSASRQRVAGEIDALARSTEHAIRVTDTAGGVSVTLSTDDVHGVSEIDVAVASRLNDLVSGASQQRIPRQRQARLNAEPAESETTADGDEARWWADSDTAEPFMGVPATTSGVMPVPLPDIAPDEPEPGIEPEQEGGAGDGLGFAMRGPGDPPATD